uniref:Uncharacterized protein n=1 Tax=Lepeophtheirus salmonis TaxID=72036 RepID=A0A0K2U9Y9_LEPSM
MGIIKDMEVVMVEDMDIIKGMEVAMEEDMAIKDMEAVMDIIKDMVGAMVTKNTEVDMEGAMVMAEDMAITKYTLSLKYVCSINSNKSLVDTLIVLLVLYCQ